MLLYDSKVFDWLVDRVASLYEHISVITTCRIQKAVWAPQHPNGDHRNYKAALGNP